MSLRAESKIKSIEVMGRVLINNSHLLWFAFGRQVDQTAVNLSLYPCIMPHASNDQGKRKQKTKNREYISHTTEKCKFCSHSLGTKKLSLPLYLYKGTFQSPVVLNIRYFSRQVYREENKGYGGIANVVFSVPRAFRAQTPPPSIFCHFNMCTFSSQLNKDRQT